MYVISMQIDGAAITLSGSGRIRRRDIRPHPVPVEFQKVESGTYLLKSSFTIYDGILLSDNRIFLNS